MSATSQIANSILRLYFNASGIAKIADNALSSPATKIYLSFHTSSPSGGNQATNEASYAGYTRIALNRSTADWAVTGNSAALVQAVTGNPNTGTSQTLTHFGLGLGGSGATQLDFYGAFSSPLIIDNGDTPQLGTDTVITVV